MLKTIHIDTSITDETTQYRTDMICDGVDDIVTANAEGSTYLTFPSGSTIYDCVNQKIYVLNAAKTEYVEV